MSFLSACSSVMCSAAACCWWHPKGASSAVGGVGLAVGRRCYLSWVYGGITMAVLRAVLLSLYLSLLCCGRLVLEHLLHVGLRHAHVAAAVANFE